ncbi:MAG: glycosyltransferase family 4 protein [Candidatus Methanomethyliaceae archaeon]
MKILYAVPYLCSPPVSTATEYHNNMIRILRARGHDITVICYADSPDSLLDLREIGCYVEAIYKHLPIINFMTVLKSMMDGTPITVKKYYSKQFVSGLCKLISDNYDIALLEHIQMAQFAPLLKERGIECVLRYHDVEAEKMIRLARSREAFYKRLYGFVESFRMLRYERKFATLFPTIVMSEHDRRLLIGTVPEEKTRGRIWTIPLGIDCDWYDYPRADIVENEILFVGPVEYFKNATSLTWFINSVFPLVKKRIPGAHLKILNITSSSRLYKSLSGKKDVVLIGYQHDIRPHLARAAVIIAPMRIASGMSGRVLTSLAMAKPLVATSMACQGIEMLHGVHAWIADTPESFAEGICILLKDKELASSLGAEGRKLVRDKYDIRRVALLMETTLNEIIKAG